MQSELNYFVPFKLKKCETETPEMPEFKKHQINVFIMTNYGRPIFVRYGDELKCSSFLATLSAICGKLSIFYSQSTNTSTIHKVIHKHMTIYLLKRRNINYVCISKVPWDELLINSMLDFLNMQVLSCFTDGVNNVLQTNPTYDPTVNFSNATVNLLSSAIKTGLYSPCILFNSIPVLPLPASARTQINTIMKENNEECLQVFILMTLSHIVAINKKKDIDFHIEDAFVLFNLLQTQKSLRSSENWLTICLPGLSADGNLFCYTSFITENLIIVMLTDQSFEKFYDFSNVSKDFKLQLLKSQAYNKINASLLRPVFDFDNTFDKVKLLKHFLIKNHELSQIVMSSFNYFGKNPREFKNILNCYAETLRLQLVSGCLRKQKMHLEKRNNLTIGVYAVGVYSIYFTAVQTISLDEIRVVLEGLFKWIKEQQNNLFIMKYS